MHLFRFPSLLALSALLLVPAPVAAQGASASATATVTVQAQQKPYIHKHLYPLATCIVSGETLEGDAVKTFAVEGRTYRTCCGKCQKKVEAEPAAYAPKLDAAIVAQQLAAYPLPSCPVSGKLLGSMGEPVRLVLDETLVQLCCSGCNKKALASPAAMAEKVRDAAHAAQGAGYPRTTCLVSGEALGADAVDLMYGTTLVRLCCKGCADDFEKAPAGFLAELAAARQKAGTAPAAQPGGQPSGGKDEVRPAAAAAHCGTECVQGLTGGCCKDAAGGTKPAGKSGAEPAAKPAGGCCQTPAVTGGKPVGSR
jgi:hypothetical protein